MRSGGLRRRRAGGRTDHYALRDRGTPMARRQKGNPDEAVTRELARITFSRGGPTLTAAQLSAMEDLLCVNGELPAEFRAFLSRQNGGDPSPSAFAWHHPQDGE